ncbi:MAG: molybdate ABC transporter permease subunit [Chloroflexi bacterium]|nr:MAG: molybdate ABC transporter permease subunit [Chloroflexota bacterium]
MARRPWRAMALPAPSGPGVRPAAAPLPFLLLAGAGAAFFILPLIGLLLRTPWNLAWDQLRSTEVLTALRLSMLASLSATAVALVVGVPLAWTFARVTFPGRAVLRAMTVLPMVLPPVVGGVALLLAFGRQGLVGSWLAQVLGIHLPFTTAGAVIAETFVAMPFLVITVEAGLRSMDMRFEDAARTLGASRSTVFWRVTLPLVRPSLVAGAVLCWARALGEFGATITFAGNFPGRTQTMPLAVYLALESNPQAAIVLSLVLLSVSLAVLIALRDRWLGTP